MAQKESEKNITEEEKPINTALLLLLTPFIGGIFLPFFFPIAKDWAWVEAWIFIFMFMVFYILIALVLNKKKSTSPEKPDESKEREFFQTCRVG